MFTGIIETVANVQSATPAPEGASRVLLRTPWKAQDIALGESIAVNGVCLTAAEITHAGNQSSDVLFFLSAETLSRSNLTLLKAGTKVNLERALRADARLSGHIVQGHVDGLARLSRVEEQAECHLMEFDLPSSLSRYCVEKGSIALNGVSLTINRLEPLGDGARIFITLIPHTWAHTSFSEFQPGDPINVEVDVLAKYVEKLCQPYLNRSNV
ncbi:MAG: riboflavin synthase [Bdellovibrionia bacterium]